MQLRFPLSLKILSWLLLNILLLGAAAFLWIRVQFRFGLDLLLTGRAGDRIQAAAELLGTELSETPPTEWNGVLKKYGQAYQTEFALFRPDGRQVAGAPVVLPNAVRDRLRERAGVGPPPQMRERFNMGPRDPNRPDEPLSGPPFEPPMRRRPEPGNEEIRVERQMRGPFPGDPPERRRFEVETEVIAGAGPLRSTNTAVRSAPFPFGPPDPNFTRARFFMRTESPVRYWAGVRLPMRQVEMPPGPPGRFMLLLISDSLSGGGLFFDYKPWVILTAAVLGLSILFWLPLVRGITKSIFQISQATEKIAEGQFETKLQTTRRDELGRLSDSINRMAEKLAGYVTGQKRFLGDIAHELCSPIARMQVALGILEQRADEKQKAYVDDVREEVQHMSGLVNELLSFSKASLGGKNIQLQPVSVRDIVLAVVEREGTGQPIQVEVADDLRALADPELLKRALGNLVRNAVRHAGGAGPLTVAASQDNERVIIAVRDQGPGVPPDALERLFTPFFRVDSARARETGGTGLGLTIVKTCVESCGGTVSCRNLAPKGFEAAISLAHPK